MEKRRITLQDGRYLIFYTFEHKPAMPREEEKPDEAADTTEPGAKPEAEEERRV